MVPPCESAGTVAPTASTPTVGDLTALRGGRDQLLPVREVAAELGVCTATVYRLCERGDLPHVRIINSIRVRPRDLAAFVAEGESKGRH
jgi:excisionase family DNA binding protein